MLTTELKKEKIKLGVLNYLKEHTKAKRSDLFIPAMESLELEKSELSDRSSNGLYSKSKSLCGITINDLIKLKILAYIDDSDSISIVKNNETITKKDIQDIYEYFFNQYLIEDEKKEKSPNSKCNKLKAFIGNIIKQNKFELESMSSNNEVFQFIQNEINHTENLRKTLTADIEKYPNTPLGNFLRQKSYYLYKSKKELNKDEYENILYHSVMEIITSAGSEFFERFSLNLIKEIYNDRIISDELTGGPTDNGIDSRIIVQDPIGLIETIIIQSKTKQKGNGKIGEKIVREFFGVMHAFSADKGILIANFEIDSQALKLVKKCKNLVVIDAKKLFTYMKEIRFGLCLNNENYDLDERFFLDEIK